MSGAFFGREPHDAFAWMRANAPVYYDEPNDLWAAASYAAVKQASVDTESFSNAGGIRPKFPPLPMMIDFDAPEHVRRRRLVSEGFTPKRVRELEDKLRLVCDAIIDQVCEKGGCDFVKDIAAPLPIIMIGDMLGVAPEDRDDLLRWSDDMLKGQGAPDPALMENATHAFVRVLRRTSTPSSTTAVPRTTPTTWSGCCATPRSTATRSTTTHWCTRRSSS